MENFFSINTAAARLDCHPETLRRIIRRGELTATKIGKHWRVSENDLAAFVAAKVRPAKVEAQS
jgi:excisionase family DNA binding protein